MARIRKHRSKWQVLYRDPKNGRERSAGVFVKKSAARQAVAEIEHRMFVDKWIDPDDKPDEISRVQFAEWWSQIEVTWRRRSDSTRSRDASYFKTLINPYIGTCTLASIDGLALEQWIAALIKNEYSPATITKAAQLVARALQEAEDREIIKRNPARAIRTSLPVIEPSEPVIITKAEAHMLGDAIGDRWRAMALFAFYTGARWGETAALRRSRLNLAQGTAHIDASLARDLSLGSPKTRQSRRIIHLPPVLLGSLRVHLDRFYAIGRDPDLVFTGERGGPIRYTNWRSRIWVPATQAAGFDGLRFHDLRHSHATMLIDAGIDPVRVASRLGHTRASMTLDRYSHLLDRDEEAILGVLNDRETDLTRTG